MQGFSIEIPNDQKKAYDLVGYLVMFMNFFAWFYINITEPEGVGKNLSVAGWIISLIPFVFLLFPHRMKNIPVFEIAFVVLGILWLANGWYFAGILMIISAVFYYFSRRKLLVKFDEAGIEYPSFPKKKFLWQDVGNAVIKDGILTIDLKDNRLFQFTLDRKIADTINEASVNSFFKDRLGTNS